MKEMDIMRAPNKPPRNAGQPTSKGAYDPERTGAFARDVIDAVNDAIIRHKISYAEYDAALDWLTKMGDQNLGWIFCDIFFDQAVEKVENAAHQGSGTTIEGPYYRPDAPLLPNPAVLPMRADEAGIPITLSGTVSSANGSPLPGARLEIWHCDGEGKYSNFADFMPGIPEWNLRGRIDTDDQGRYSVRSIRPVNYPVFTPGAINEFFQATRWDPMRPAHFHLKVSAPGHRVLTTQIYFSDDPKTESDIAMASKKSLVTQVQKDQNGSQSGTYDFRLVPQNDPTRLS